MNNRQTGFTMLEMVVVLMIAALLLAGVMAGSKVVRNSQLNTIVEETELLQKGINGFIATYNALPGDIADATDKLGATFGGVAILNGNGNGILDGSEGLYVFQHLAAAGYIAGVYDGATAQPGVGLMASATDPNIAYEITASSNAIFIKASKYTTATGAAAFTPQEAYQIDAKYDDGDPDTATGIIIASLGTSNVGNCINVGAYDLSNSSDACVLTFRSKTTPATARAAVVAANGCPNGTAAPSAIGATRTVRDCYTEFGLGAGSKTIIEECQTGGYWAVQTTPTQTCP